MHDTECHSEDLSDMRDLFNNEEEKMRIETNQKKITGIKIHFHKQENKLMDDIMNMENEIKKC